MSVIIIFKVSSSWVQTPSQMINGNGGKGAGKGGRGKGGRGKGGQR